MVRRITISLETKTTMLLPRNWTFENRMIKMRFIIVTENIAYQYEELNDIGSLFGFEDVMYCYLRF